MKPKLAASGLKSAAITALIALLAGCTAPMADVDAQGEGNAAQGEVITMWRPITSDAEQTYIQENFVDAYNATNPVNPVEVSYRDWNTAAQLQQASVAAGEGPDIIYTAGPSNALAYIQAGQLLPLNKYAEEFGWNDKIQPWALETGYSEANLYLIPETYETMLMLYSPETFEANGWSVASNRSDFDTFVQQSQDAGMTAIATGNKSWAPTTEHLLSVVLNNVAGPEAVYEALSGNKSWTDPEFVDAITTMKGWFDSKAMGGGSEMYFSTTVEELYNSIATDTASTYWTGSWAFNNVGEYFPEDGQGKSWDWSLVPPLSDRVSEPPVSIGIGRTIAVNAATKNPDGAAANINWLIKNPKAQLAKTAAIGVAPMPLMFDAADFPADIDPRVASLYQTIADAKTIGYLTWTFWPPKSNRYLYEEMDKVIVGDLSVEDYLAGLDALFAQELAEGLVPPRPNPSN